MASLLFLSGMCALIFQIAWMREFRLVFGASTPASAAVLAIFMGGLGLGNAFVGRRADRHRNPLALYATLELAIAVTAALTPWMIDLIRALYVSLGGQMVLGGAGAAVVRLTLSTLVLGVPTLLMGGTLPAAAKAVTSADDSSRRDAAFLYGMNTLGAVLGATLGTLVLLELLGTRATLWLACLVNLMTALCAYGLSRKLLQPNAGVAAPPETTAPAGSGPATLPAAFVYATAGIVGFAFFLMELVWFRMLGPLLGGTTFSFGLILAVALFGIGAGGAAYTWIFAGSRPTPRSLALICGLEALGIAVPFALGDRIALLALRLRATDLSSFATEVAGWTIVAGIVVLPAALASGVQFPMLIALLGRGNKDIGKQVGQTFAWNTVGAIVGSLAGGFGLLPSLTAPGTWSAVVVLLAALTLLVLGLSYRTERSTPGLVLAVAVGVAPLLCLLAPGPSAVWRHSGIGAGRADLKGDTPNAVREWIHRQRRGILWEAEGVETSVALAANDGLEFVVNGKTDGNAAQDAASFIMPGIIGAILHPQPTRALVVGLGTGESAGWLAEIATMERVDVVELEPAIDEVARLCAAANRDVMEHAKVRLFYNDAREMLLTTPERYDLIFSQPSNPYRAGIAGLFTREFYAAVHGRLNPEGLFLQWMQAYEIDEPTVNTVLRTLHAEFPSVEIWQSGPHDLLMVCSTNRVPYSVEALRLKIQDEPIRSALSACWRAVDLEGLLARFLAGAPYLRWIGEQAATRINTDDRNQLEYGAARTVGRTEQRFSIPALRAAAAAHGAGRPALTGGEVDWARVQDQQLFSDILSSVVRREDHLEQGENARARAFARMLGGDMRGAIDAWASQPRDAFYPSEIGMLAYAHAYLGETQATPLLARLAELEPTEARAIEALLLLRERRTAEAAGALEAVFHALRDDPWSRWVQFTFPMALDLVQQDASQAACLYAALREPFALHRFDDKRRLTACHIAEILGPAPAAECVASFEPYVPWTKSFLELRLRAYTRAGTPAAPRAVRDLEDFVAAEAGGS